MISREKNCTSWYHYVCFEGSHLPQLSNFRRTFVPLDHALTALITTFETGISSQKVSSENEEPSESPHHYRREKGNTIFCLFGR